MWNVTVRVPRSVDADVVKYRLFRDGTFDGEVAQPASGDPTYSYSIPADGTYALQVSAVDGAGNEQPVLSDPLVVPLDHVNPAVMAKLVLVAATWVP